MMFVLLTMIMVVAAFAIVVTLVMMIMEKSGDIAILKAMGADDSTIERVFAIEGRDDWPARHGWPAPPRALPSPPSWVGCRRRWSF